MTSPFLKHPMSLIRRTIPAMAVAALAATILMQPAAPARAQDDAASPAAQIKLPSEFENRKFDPPQDITVVTKSEWSKATPLDAYYGVISSMLADNPHWQAEATVLNMRESVRAQAGGKMGLALHKMLQEKISRIAVMQIITRGDTAIVITIKEHKPDWQHKEAYYSSDVFGFEKEEDGWYYNPRRSSGYPGCHVIFMGSMRPPVDHYYCLVSDGSGYFTLDKTIQNDAKFNKAMFGADPSRYKTDD